MSNRQRAHLATGALLTLVLVAGCAEPPSPPGSVLLIVVDTLRADHLGAYGYERQTSPGIDRWAERGVVFDRALTTSPWTVPAVGSILTARLPAQHGGGLRPEDSSGFYDLAPIDERVVTLAEYLSGRGFATGAIVSNPFFDERFGAAQGFATYEFSPNLGPWRLVEKALEWIGRQEGPYFLLLHIMDPHMPYQPPEPFKGRFTEGDRSRRHPPLSELVRRSPEVLAGVEELMIGRYDEEISWVDSQVARLLDTLGDEIDEMLVVLTSDHGEEFLERGRFGHGHSARQEQLWVPLLLWSPELAPRRVATPVSLVDLSPTILESLGFEPEGLGEGLAGRSFLDLAAGADRAHRRPIIAERLLIGDELKALIRWPDKLVLDPVSGSRELFDLEADPGEARDLAEENPATADRLERELRRYIEATDTAAAGAVELTPEQMRELEVLGYVD